MSPPSNPVKDPRTYTWRRDTLGDGTYQSTIWNIWGSSSKDVYFVGPTSALFSGKIWHYDGTSYTDLTPKYVEAFPGQQIFPYDCWGVYGFSSNDIWIVGDRDTSSIPAQVKKGFVMHFDGSQWRGNEIPSAHGLDAVGGKSSSDLWVGGTDGLLFHFDGSVWQQHAIPDSISVQRFCGVLAGSVYMAGISLNNTTGAQNVFLLENDGLDWRIDEFQKTSSGNLNFWVFIQVYEGVLYSSPFTSFKKRVSQGVWQTLYSNTQASFLGLAVNSLANVFLVGGGTLGEEVYQYNGNDWYRFPLFTNPNIYEQCVWTDGKEVFISGGENAPQSKFWPRSFVLHGK